MIIISDASILIGLARIGQLSLLEKLYSQVTIPEAVWEEVSVKVKPGEEAIKKAPFIKVEKVEDDRATRLLLGSLGEGEAEVLTLAKEKNADLILIDEKKARKIARGAGFKMMGILGLMIVAKGEGIIENIKPLLEKLNEEGFRLSGEVIRKVLEEAEEAEYQ